MRDDLDFYNVPLPEDLPRQTFVSNVNKKARTVSFDNSNFVYIGCDDDSGDTINEIESRIKSRLAEIKEKEETHNELVCKIQITSNNVDRRLKLDI